MPITLPPLNRRDWLKQCAAASAGLLTSRLAAAPSADASESWILFSDTHIAEDLNLEMRGACMAKHLEQAVREALTRSAEKPFGLLLNGDCALKDGQPGDYSALVELMHPIREAGIPVHLTLGNHDHRENFLAACGTLDTSLLEEKKPVEGKHVAAVGSALANWVLLDSLDVVNGVPGTLGEAQLGWIHRTLRDLPDKPVIVMVHHNPQGPAPEGGKKTGLLDSDRLFQVIAAHPKVKALVYGHTHNWEIKTHKETGIHLVNLPPVAYVFNAARPSGWVTATLKRDGMELKLHSLNPSHPEHRKTVALEW